MLEIERKFLVDSDKLKKLNLKNGIAIKQGYIFDTEQGVLRVRIKGNKGYLTLKSSNIGQIRNEFEYEIPIDEANELFALFCKSWISKTRYLYPYEGKTWEIDIFHEQLAPLILAELELSNEDEAFALPEFITKEVTEDVYYYNSNLIKVNKLK
jgi:adenylate cyclase